MLHPALVETAAPHHVQPSALLPAVSSACSSRCTCCSSVTRHHTASAGLIALDATRLLTLREPPSLPHIWLTERELVDSMTACALTPWVSGEPSAPLPPLPPPPPPCAICCPRLLRLPLLPAAAAAATAASEPAGAGGSAALPTTPPLPAGRVVVPSLPLGAAADAPPPPEPPLMSRGPRASLSEAWW